MNETTVRRTHNKELRIYVHETIKAALLEYARDKGLNYNAASRMFITDRLRAEGYLKNRETQQ